jgi:homoserine dehydrogenase
MFNGMPFEEALKKAQELGFAEADPTADLEGYDMMRKIAILSDLAWDTLVDINLIDHKGISDVSLDMIEHAKNNNKVIKFVCEATLLEEQIKVEVKPKYFDDNHFFASVQNEFNSVILETDPNDQLIYIGKGAGSLPTASAIVSDVVDIINNRYLDNYQNTKKYKVN